MPHNKDNGPVDPERQPLLVTTQPKPDSMSIWTVWGNKTRSDGHSSTNSPPRIYYSVFRPPPGVEPLQLRDHAPLVETGPVGRDYFESAVADVETAIESGAACCQPRRIASGSSGSYFVYSRSGECVAVFKPKEEEPYGPLSPKWTKWFHRNLFPCFFGRSCLIPNNGYICEAAASTLDRLLQTFLVPYTDTVYLSSNSFYITMWDRLRKRKRKSKIGSFQLFLNGYEQTNVFLRKHPLPSTLDRDAQQLQQMDDDLSRGRVAPSRSGSKSRSRSRPKSDGSDYDDGAGTDGSLSDPESLLHALLRTVHQPHRHNKQFDPAHPVEDHSGYYENGYYNYDYDPDAFTSRTRSVASGGSGEPATSSRAFQWTPNLVLQLIEEIEKLVILDYIMRNTDRGLDNWMIKVDYESDSTRIRVAAIDSGLAFPWKHPDEWRSYPYGWLFLPTALIGQRFSQRTKDHFLPLLCSADWWGQAYTALREVFERDSDFKERMFRKQWAVLRGQAFNVIETLKTHDQGPLQLARKPAFLVYDDIRQIPSMTFPQPDGMWSFADSASTPDSPSVSTTGPTQDNKKKSKPHSSLLRRNHTAGGSLAVESRYKQLSLASTSQDDLWPALVNSNELGEPPSSPSQRNFDFDRTRQRASHMRPAPSSSKSQQTIGYSAAMESEHDKISVVVERAVMITSKPPVFAWC